MHTPCVNHHRFNRSSCASYVQGVFKLFDSYDIYRSQEVNLRFPVQTVEEGRYTSYNPDKEKESRSSWS